MKSIPFLIIITALMGLLSACAPGSLAFSPENAVIQELLQDPEIIPDSIRIHQTQAWRNSRIVLASYFSSQDNEQMSCEAVFEMQRDRIGWRTSESGIGCSIPPNTEAVTFGSGAQGIAPDDLSYAHGQVTLSAANMVEITWQDGVTQSVPVVNGSYLGLREGTIRMIARIEVFDATQILIHEIEIMPDVEKLP